MMCSSHDVAATGVECSALEYRRPDVIDVDRQQAAWVLGGRMRQTDVTPMRGAPGRTPDRTSCQQTCVGGTRLDGWMDEGDARRVALALPEVTERQSWGQ